MGDAIANEGLHNVGSAAERLGIDLCHAIGDAIVGNSSGNGEGEVGLGGTCRARTNHPHFGVIGGSIIIHHQVV